jgi:hypothetical protein
MKLKRALIPALLALITSALIGTGLAAGTASASNKHHDNLVYRWDIIQIDFAAGTLSAGGQASAIAEDGSMITLTGKGTFVAGEEVGDNDVTGGGSWQASDPSGMPTGHGTYRVTNFVRFKVAPGAPAPLTDLIGNPANARAGLLFVAIRFSDGSTGVLTVSCHIPGPPSAPPTVFEGIRVSKGFVDYWNGTEPPPPPANGNRTLFHIIGHEDE